MIASGYFTRRDLALIIGLDLMESDLQEIAREMGRSELDITNGLRCAHALIHDPVILSALNARRAKSAQPVPVIRRPSVVPMRAPPVRALPPQSPRTVTAALMGDPPPGRSALDHLHKEMSHGNAFPGLSAVRHR